LSVDITNESARKAFRISSEAIAGGSTHYIHGGPRGIDETLYTQLRVKRGMRGISPVVSGYVTVDGQRFLLLGIDPFSAMGKNSSLRWNELDSAQLMRTNNAVLMLASTAKRLGVRIPAEITVRISGIDHTVHIVDTIEPADELQRYGLRNVLITDISDAQKILGMIGRLTRIDVTTTDTEHIDAILPPSLTLIPNRTRGENMEQMTRAFHLNLTALSLLALVIGAFLIYNTMTLAVLQRRRQFAVLRTLGVTPGQLFGGIVVEALLFAATGLAAGALAGTGLAIAMLHLVGGTINDLYFLVEVKTVSLTAQSLVKAVVLAFGVTLAAACIPAWEAMRATPAANAIRSRVEGEVRRRHSRLLIWGIASWGMAAVILLLSGHSIVAGFGALFMIIMGCALITPAVMVKLLGLLAPVLFRHLGVVGRMASRGVLSSLSRTQVAVAALAIAVSAVVGVSVMISSFRGSVEYWLNNYLRADIYVAQQQSHQASGIDRDLIADIARQPGVDNLITGRWVTLQDKTGFTQLYAVGLDRAAFSSYQLVHREHGAVWPAFSRNDAVIISEPYAYRHDLAVGDDIVLPTEGGEKAFEVSAVFYDYGSDQGVVVMHRSTYDRHWNDPVVSSFALYLTEQADPEAFVDRLRRNPLVNRTLRVRSNRTLRERSLQIFDRTFTITDILRWLAVIIAVVGILSALTAIQLERAKEFAVLRATGLTPRQLWGLIATESGLMGLIAGIIACPLGLVTAWVLIFIINKRSFGWSMDMSFNIEPWITALVLSVAAALVAGIYPAWRMAATPPAEALRYE
jgi:putative ABC transport system permease protein